tara:strand:- start:129 stop:641 length:513 start_codon:yes stop_codon:yes gene_type:complete
MLGAQEAAFVQDRDGFYQATVSETGWPYVQFRGGPPGFVKVIDPRTIAYADYRGNRQYLSLGNLTGDGRISLILMDYPNRRRLKIWGRAQIVEGDDAKDLLDALHKPGDPGRPERAIVIHIEAIDWNCPSHIPQRLTLAEMQPQIDAMRAQIAQLTAENARLSQHIEHSI